MSSATVVRDADAADAAPLAEMIRELAEFERLLDVYRASEAALRETLFAPDPPARALLAERDGVPVGYAIYFTTYSTFLAAPGIWIEDVYVRPSARRAGVGTALLAAVAGRVVGLGDGRMEWSALDWNERALTFYRGLGAELLDEWLMLRLSGAPRRALAGAATA